MIFKKLLASQFKKPRGLLGHYSASFMNKNNTDYYTKTIDLLNIVDNDHVLEIGCGAGQALKMISEMNKKCRLVGIDFSKFMINKAIRLNQENITSGRMKFIASDFESYKFETTYSKAFLINVIYFWNNISINLRKIYDVIHNDGFVIIYMSSPERLNQIPFAVDSVFNKYSIEYVKSQILEVGFKKVECVIVLKNNLETYFIKATK